MGDDPPRPFAPPADAVPPDAQDAPPLEAPSTEPPSTETLRRLVGGVAALLLLLFPAGTSISTPVFVFALGVLLVAFFPRAASKGDPWPRLLLAIGGVLVLAGPFLAANPYVGRLSTGWPWAWLLESRSWAERTDLVLWGSLGVFAIAAAIRGGVRPWQAALPFAFLLVAARAYGAPLGSTAIVRLVRLNLPWMLSASILGGVFVHVGGGRVVRPRVARFLALAGGLGMLSAYVTWFPERDHVLQWSFAWRWQEARRVVEAVLLGGEAEPETAANLSRQLWISVVPFACEVAGAFVGFWLAASRAPGDSRWSRWLARLGWLLVLATWLLPLRTALTFETAEVGLRATQVANIVGDALLRTGLPMYVLGGGLLALALAALSPGSEGSRSLRTAAEGLPREPARAWTWAYAGALLLGILLLFLQFRADEGALAPLGPLALLARGQWDPLTAALLYEVGFLIVMAVALFRVPSVGRGAACCLAALIVFVAMTDPSRRVYSVDTFFPATLLSLVAAATWILADTRGSAFDDGSVRRAAIGGASVLLALLLLPVDLPDTGIAGPKQVPLEYHGWLLTETLSTVFAGRTWAESMERLTHPGRITALCVTLASVLAIAFAIRPTRRKIAYAVVTLFFATIAVPLAYAVFGDPAPEQDGVAPASLARRVVPVLQGLGIPFVLALVAGWVDTLRGRSRDDGAMRRV